MLQPAKMRSLFWQMCSGLSLDQFVTLLSCGTEQPQFYVLDWEKKSAWIPEPKLIAWPIQLVLTHHPKHILAGRREIDLQKLGVAVEEWSHRFRWKLALQKCPPSEWKQFRARLPMQPFPKPLDGNLEGFISQTKSKLMHGFRRIKARMRSRRQEATNFSAVHKLGLRMLKQGPMAALLTDKDGGFALVEKSVVKDVRRQTCLKRHYKPVSLSREN